MYLSKKHLMEELAKRLGFKVKTGVNKDSNLYKLLLNGQLRGDTSQLTTQLEEVMKVYAAHPKDAANHVSAELRPILSIFATAVKEQKNVGSLLFRKVKPEDISKMVVECFGEARKTFDNTVKEVKSDEGFLTQDFQAKLARHLLVHNRGQRPYMLSDLESAHTKVSTVSAPVQEHANAAKIEERKQFVKDLKYLNQDQIKEYGAEKWEKDLAEAESDLRAAYKEPENGNEQDLARLFHEYMEQRPPRAGHAGETTATQEEKKNFETNRWKDFSDYILVMQQNPERLKSLHEWKNNEPVRNNDNIAKRLADKAAAADLRDRQKIDSLQAAYGRSAANQGTAALLDDTLGKVKDLGASPQAMDAIRRAAHLDPSTLSSIAETATKATETAAAKSAETEDLKKQLADKDKIIADLQKEKEALSKGQNAPLTTDAQVPAEPAATRQEKIEEALNAIKAANARQAPAPQAAVSNEPAVSAPPAAVTKTTTVGQWAQQAKTAPVTATAAQPAAAGSTQADKSAKITASLPLGNLQNFAKNLNASKEGRTLLNNLLIDGLQRLMGGPEPIPGT